MQNDSIILSVKRFIKKSPFLTRFLLAYVDNFYFNYSDLKKFLKQNRSKSIKLNLGSGPIRAGSSFMNVDMESYPGVTLCSDVHSLPIRENSVDAICCMQLLEHVVDPHKMIAEAWRVLKPGGEIFISAPFMYPYHEAPIDLNRWTKSGMRHIMKDFHKINIGVLGGPTAALIEMFHGWLSILLSFNSERVYQFVYLFLLPILQPFKILDLILLNKYQSSYRTATALFFYGKKPTLREEGRDYSLNSLIR